MSCRLELLEACNRMVERCEEVVEALLECLHVQARDRVPRRLNEACATNGSRMSV